MAQRAAPPCHGVHLCHLTARALEIPTAPSWSPASWGYGWDVGSAMLSPTPAPASPAVLGDAESARLAPGVPLAGGAAPPARSMIKQSEQRHRTKCCRHPGRPPSSTAVICQGECLPITGTSLLFYCELYKDKKKGWA